MAADLANILLTGTVRSPGISDRDYDHLLRRVSDDLRKSLSIKSGKRIDDVELLQVLHPGTNTLGYTFLLNHLNIDRASDTYLISLVGYLTQFDPVQVRYAGAEFRRILEVTEEVIRSSRNLQLLEPLRNAILRLDPDCSTFTTNHHNFLVLCLEARRPRMVLPILDKEIVDFPSKQLEGIEATLPCAADAKSSTYMTRQPSLSAEVTVLQVQEYFLLAAHVYIGVRNFDRARTMLELVLAAPAQHNATDLYMVEAYKKLVLVGLVAKGYPFSVNHLAENAALKSIQLVSKQYDALSEAFRNRDIAKFHAEVDTAGSVWQDDGNLGLVHEAAESLRRHRVIDLQRTYASLPVEGVATSLSMTTEATLQLLQDMIQQGHIQAAIASPSGASHLTNGASSASSGAVLRFSSWSSGMPSQDESVSSEGAIAKQVERIAFLSEAVKQADRRLAITKEYAEYLRRNKKSADAGAAVFEDPMDMDNGADMPGSFADDEDIMAA